MINYVKCPLGERELPCWVNQLFRIMKLTTFLLVIGCLHLSVASEAQTVTLAANRAPLTQILADIETQTGYLIVYNDRYVNDNELVTINVKNQPLEKVLHNLLTPRLLRYHIEDRTIAVSNLPNNNVQNTNRYPAAGVNNFPQQTVTGRVTDELGNPMGGVTVAVKGTETSASTDDAGNYRIAVPQSGSSLVFSMVGFSRVELAVNGRSNIDVSMNSLISDLEEVVVVGYGTQKKVNITGSIETVSSKDLENRPITSSSQALQGVTGVYVNQAGGQPGRDGATIRIRGQGTLNNNNPLVIIDGVEQSIDHINPNDIESVSVLKDAASASIYGNRAASGVILITTKRGSGERFSLRYNNNFSLQQATYLPDLIYDPIEYMELRNQAQRNGGRVAVDFSDAIIDEYRAGMLTNPYTYPKNNWMDIMFKNALMQEHNVQLSSGSEKLSSFLSLGYLDQDGVLINTNSKRFSLRSNIDYKLNEFIQIGSDISVSNQNIRQSAASIGGGESLMQNIWKMKGYDATYNEDGTYADTWVVTPGHGVNRHPLVWANEGYNKDNGIRGFINLFANVKLPFGLKYHVKVNGIKTMGLTDVFVPEIYMYDNKTLDPIRVTFNTSPPSRHVRNRYDEVFNTTLFNTLSWNGTLDKHEISGLVGGSFERFSNRFFDGKIEGFLGNDLQVLNAGSVNQTTRGTTAENYLIGYFGRLNYNFDGKYLLELNLRYDGSSRFAKGNQWGMFPSMSAGWRLSNEKFVENIDWISNLMVRFSYGSLGNERIGNFQYINTFNQQLPYIFDNQVAQGAATTEYRDPNISWETTQLTNIGLDGTFFRDQLSLSIELYKKRTKDVLRGVQIPSYVGNLTGPVQNLGVIDNDGAELNIDYRNQISELRYNIGVGVNYNRNKVVSLRGETIISGMYITKEGYPIDSYYIWEHDGIFQNQNEIDNSPFINSAIKPGYLKYKDQNGDNVIDQDDRTIIGGVIPKYTYSFNLGLGYKGFNLTALFNGVSGVNKYPKGSMAIPFWFGSSVSEEWRDQSWTPERTGARLPIMVPWELGQNDLFANSDFWLRNASYLRLKNIQLSYTLSGKSLERIGADGMTVFINGQNLLTFSKMKDFDPESSLKGNDFFEYPSVKAFSCGINLSF